MSNPKLETPAFAPQGGASRRQAKLEINPNAQNTKLNTRQSFDLQILDYLEDNSLTPLSPGGRGRGEGDIQYAPHLDPPRQGGG